jgi:hypothetical protein
MKEFLVFLTNNFKQTQISDMPNTQTQPFTSTGVENFFCAGVKMPLLHMLVAFDCSLSLVASADFCPSPVFTFPPFPPVFFESSAADELTDGGACRQGQMR